MPNFHVIPVSHLALHVGVGMGAASFWRGAWYLLDDHLYPNDACKSAVASTSLGVLGLGMSQGVVHTAEHFPSSPRWLRPIGRLSAVYGLAWSCVLLWRGTWIGWDVFYENVLVKYRVAHPPPPSPPDEADLTTTPDHYNHHHHAHHGGVSATDPTHLTNSGLWSHGASILLLGSCGLLTSVLAPPAAIAIIRDRTVRGIPPKTIR